MTGIQSLLVMDCMVKPARGIDAEIAVVQLENFDAALCAGAGRGVLVCLTMRA
jgi:hypothetical protein